MRLLVVDRDEAEARRLVASIVGLRENWIVLGCGSAEQARESMRCDPPDALLASFSGAGEDGLLDHAARSHPSCFRVTIQRGASLSDLARILDHGHRCFSSPSDPELLAEAVETGVGGLRKIGSPDLRAWVAANKSLPDSPRIYNQVSALAEDPRTSAADLAHVIEKDPALAARLLRTANSSFFGQSGRVGNVSEAVGIIGTELVRFVVLGSEVFSGRAREPWQEDLWAHSLQVATLARRVAMGLKSPGADAFTAGLLHDAGKLILADVMGDEAWAALAKRDADTLLWVAEQNHLGASHAEAGAVLFDVWGLPQKIVDGVRWHHQPSRCPSPSSTCATAVHIANMLAHNWQGRGRMSPCDALWLEESGVPFTPQKWEKLRGVGGPP